MIVALSGAGWEWWHDPSRNQSTQTKPATTSRPPHAQAAVPFIPNAFQGLEGFLVGANGPLESPHRKQARIAEEARQRTRQLVAIDRSNVNCAQMNCIALTYDDGPEPGLTLELLTILKQRRAVATFFVLGSRVPGQAATLEQLAKARNEIGNHTWSHRNLRKLTDQEIADELHHTNEAILNATGQRPRLMRPPMGEYDERVAKATQMPLAFWSVDPRDWRDRDPLLIYQRSLHGAERGKVILLHDTYPTTIEASKHLIDELQRQGYILVTMSELFGITDSNTNEFSGRILRYR